MDFFTFQFQEYNRVCKKRRYYILALVFFKELYNSLKNTKAKFILSTWHHNDYRSNLMIDKYWSEFNIITRDHFYHSGAKIENRQSIVEALVFNYEVNIKKHNSDQSEKPEQFALGY